MRNLPTAASSRTVRAPATTTKGAIIRRLAVALICTTTALFALAAEAALAAFPGRPGPIAYPKTLIRELGGGETFEDGGIYARRAARGQRPRQLTLSPVDGEPSFSANGRRLVFTSNSERSRMPGIFQVTNQGRQRRETRAIGSNPAFFPNGTRILFAGKDQSGYSHIYAARANGTRIRQLTSGANNDTEPAISPNGRRIAFVSDRDGGGTDIFAMRANGTGIRSLVAAPGNESGPDWAPGGGRIAYASTRGRGPSNVFLAATNGLWIRWLTRCLSSDCAAFSAPAFSPRGRRIAVLRSGTRSTAVIVIAGDRRRPPLATIDSGSIDEEGSGIVIGPPTWGPAVPGRR